MKGTIKGSPATSAEKSSSGKKLVQARLPFKILSSPLSITTSEENDKRKRKLSSDNDLPAAKILCASEIKENVSSCGDAIVVSEDDESDDGKEGNSVQNPFVKLHKIDDFIRNSQDENGRIVLSPKTPKTSKTIEEERSASVGSKSSGKSNKFVIKLPLSNKKKRKLSEKLNASRSPERSSAENTPEEVKVVKKFKTSAESSSKCNVVEITDDDDTLSANIRLHVTNMSEDSVLESSKLMKTPIKAAQGFPPEEAANDSELFSVIRRERGKSEAPGAREDVENKSDDEDDEEEANLQGDGDDCQLVSEEKEKEENASPKKVTDDCIKKPDTPLKVLDEAGRLQQKPLTPKQLQKIKEREEKIKQKEEEKLQKQKEKEEKERQRKREKEEKEEQRRKEREEKEEQKRKEREEKDEQRRKEKEEKEKKRLAEIEAKNEERRKKEELKEEERRKKEEDKRRKELEKEEAENKKRKAAEVFTKFFLQSKPAKEPTEEDQNSVDSEKFRNSTFMPFQVKGDMKLAPLFRRILDSKAKVELDEILQNPKPTEELYLNCLKSGKILLGKDTKTWLKDEDNVSDCLVVGKF